MATVLDSYRWSRRRPRAYPWHRWFDGRIWELERGRDFHCTAETMAGIASGEAARRGLRLKTSVECDDVLVLQRAGFMARGRPSKKMLEVAKRGATSS